MSHRKTSNASDPSSAQRRDLLRGAVALAAGAAALAGATSASAQAAESEARWFPGFKSEDVKTSDGAVIRTVRAGNGPPVLLLHGAPQSKASWHAVAKDLARDHTVIAADLRGYGDSSKVQGSATHIEYSKRTMANDQVDVMRHFGFERFTVFGHDRGARLTHRLALDHPDRVERAAVLDIVPTHYLFTHVTKEFAESAYHWFFYARPAPFPETVIANSLELFVGRGAGDLGPEFLRTYKIPGTLHAMCEDYRAGASIDLEHDEADLDKKVQCPLLVLWGQQGSVNGRYDALGLWGERAARVTGKLMPGGHSFQESHPQETIAELRAFMRG